MIYVCSPYSAYKNHTVEQNVAEAKEFCRQIIASGNVPVCPQIWLPEFLDDSKPHEREKAIMCCQILVDTCDTVNVYSGEDGYISDGMTKEIEEAKNSYKEIVMVGRTNPLRGKYREFKYQKEIEMLKEMRNQCDSYEEPLYANALDTAIKVLKEEK